MPRPTLPESQRRVPLTAKVAPETRAKLAALTAQGMSLGAAIDQAVRYLPEDPDDSGSYSRQGEWSGWTVHRTAAGWVYSNSSRIQGCTDGYRALVHPNPDRGLPADLPLHDRWNDNMDVGEYIAMLAEECPDRVLRRGNKVQ